jgi:hypothetical protein
VLIFSERLLLHHLTSYVVYFNQVRPHQGIDQHIPAGPLPLLNLSSDGAIVGFPILNGLHHDYQRHAA